MKQPNNFLMFLKDKHYYSLFRRNFSSRKIRNMFNDKYFIDALNDSDPWNNSSLLGCAFSWAFSKEGYNFWSKVNREMNKEQKRRKKNVGSKR